MARYRAPVLTIDDRHPAEYAAGWGDGTSSTGVMYYNCSHSAGQYVVANPEWTAAQWREFAAAIAKDRKRVRERIRTPEGRAASGWTFAQVRELAALERWSRARAKGPQFFAYCCGSGREIVRLTEAQVFSCAGSGDQGGNVAAIVDKVEWRGDDATVRKFLQEYGAWDAEELKDPQSNRERALWLACCDISERPEDYAE